MQVHGFQGKKIPLRLSLEFQLKKKRFIETKVAVKLCQNECGKESPCGLVGLGFRGVAHNVLPCVRNPFTCTKQLWLQLGHQAISDITYCTSFRHGKRQCTAKTWNSKKKTWNRDQKQANYISIHWHCKNNTSANHQALEKTSTQYQSPPSPQNTAYYIEQLRRPHFYHLAHGNRTSVLIHSSLAWFRVHEPNPLWNCKKRKR